MTALSARCYVTQPRKTPENPPKTTKEPKWTTETRQGGYIFLIFFSEKVTFYFIVPFYPSLFEIPYNAL